MRGETLREKVPPQRRQDKHKPGIHLKRDNSVSVQYAEELNSITISAVCAEILPSEAFCGTQ